MFVMTLNILMFAGALWGAISCAGAGNMRAACWAACTAIVTVNLIIVRLA